MLVDNLNDDWCIVCRALPRIISNQKACRSSHDYENTNPTDSCKQFAPSALVHFHGSHVCCGQGVSSLVSFLRSGLHKYVSSVRPVGLNTILECRGHCFLWHS